MKQAYRFLALRIQVGAEEYKKAILVVDAQGCLQSIQPIDAELANTRYMEGKLWVLPAGADPTQTTEIRPVQVGDVVTIWQLLPFDLVHNQSLPQTRLFKVTLS